MNPHVKDRHFYKFILSGEFEMLQQPLEEMNILAS